MAPFTKTNDSFTAFIDNGFPHACPMDWSPSGADRIDIRFIADHERYSPNRQWTHANFKLCVMPDRVGQTVTLRIRQVPMCWSGIEQLCLGTFDVYLAISDDGGQNWRRIATQRTGDAEFPIEVQIKMSAPVVQIARCVPYALADLEQWLLSIRLDSQVGIEPMGFTVRGRSLEMVTLGDWGKAQKRLFIRCRAHPWEPGGNWFCHGLTAALLGRRRDMLSWLSVAIMPMASKDGVDLGWTRFNLNGVDLNRGWSSLQPFDPKLAPESACLLDWYFRQQQAGCLPDFSIDFHDDMEGHLHLTPTPQAPAGYFDRMARLDSLLRKHTWYCEGPKPPSDAPGSSFECGIAERFGLDAVVWELNTELAQGLNRAPLHTDWIGMGDNFAEVLSEYFQA